VTIRDLRHSPRSIRTPAPARTHGRPAAFLFVAAAVCLLLAATSSARPERIRPGQSYYSDDQVSEGGVRDIADEKNYEEVYQAYRYFEVVYDEAERVVVFKEFKRGDVARTEEYRYSDDGDLAVRVIREPGRPVEIIAVEATDETAGESEAAR